MNTNPLRPDRSGPHRVAFEKNKNIILKTRNTCGICGQPVDKDLKYPHPLSPVIDHIVPVNKNGHPSDNAIDRSRTSYTLMKKQMEQRS